MMSHSLATAAEQHIAITPRHAFGAKGANAKVEFVILHGKETVCAFRDMYRRSAASVSLRRMYMQQSAVKAGWIGCAEPIPAFIDVVEVGAVRHERRWREE
jgi:hypothetical protein